MFSFSFYCNCEFLRLLVKWSPERHEMDRFWWNLFMHSRELKLNKATHFFFLSAISSWVSSRSSLRWTDWVYYINNLNLFPWLLIHGAIFLNNGYACKSCIVQSYHHQNCWLFSNLLNINIQENKWFLRMTAVIGILFNLVV